MTRFDYASLLAIYQGSHGEDTKALYDALCLLGARGEIAINLFRAHKSSSRAKVYRGGERGRGSFRSMAYERKQWSLDNLSTALSAHAEEIGLSWGWAEDRTQPFHRYVLYVELPTGQVSFHSAVRGAGPDYDKAWDGVRNDGPTRICRWIASVTAEATAP